MMSWQGLQNYKIQGREAMLGRSDSDSVGSGVSAPDPFIKLEIEIRRFCSDHIEKTIPEANLNQYEIEKRTGAFLQCKARVVEWKRLFTEQRNHSKSLERTAFKIAIQMQGKGGVTENKLKAEADPEYQKYRELYEHYDSVVSYLRAYRDIFQDAHIMFRQLSRSD